MTAFSRLLEFNITYIETSSISDTGTEEEKEDEGAEEEEEE